jgi:hypothetical protein
MATWARSKAIEAGAIRPVAPEAGAPTPVRWVDLPTLRIDEAGRREAARRIAFPSWWDPNEPQRPEVRR